MDSDKLEELFSKIDVIEVQPFNDEGVSSTQLENGRFLNMIAGSKTLMMYMAVETLGEAGEENPDIYKHLLSVNSFGGRFGNLRVTYEEDSATVWLCYDIDYDILSSDLLSEKIKVFENVAPEYIQLIREEIIYTYINEEDKPTTVDNDIKSYLNV